MAGVPPLAGFFSKFYMLYFAMTTYELILTFIGLFSSLLGAYYYLRFIQFMIFEPVTKNNLGFIKAGLNSHENGMFITMLSKNLFVLIEFNAWVLAYIMIVDLGLQCSTGALSVALNYILNDFVNFFTVSLFF
jgi:NADH:ubiquinone oxidoreductase subunit 2 (subunit N)